VLTKDKVTHCILNFNLLHSTLDKIRL